jgi:hypothetical protein
LGSIQAEEAHCNKKAKWEPDALENVAKKNLDDAGVAQVQQVSTGGHGEEALYLSILRDTPRRLGLLTPKGNFRKLMRPRFDHPWTAVEQQKECERVARSVLAIVLKIGLEPWARVLVTTGAMVDVAWDIFQGKDWHLL